MVFSKKGIGTHVWRKHGAGQNHKSILPGYKAWNKGLNKSDARVNAIALKVSITMKEKFRTGVLKPRSPTDEERCATSIRMSTMNPGGKSKWFLSCGKKVQGTWELRVSEILNKFGIEWTKPGSISYIFDGKNKTYTPDLFIPEIQKFLEIKGYWWGNDKLKMKLVCEQNPDFALKLKIIERNEFDALLECKNANDVFTLLTT